VSRVWTVLVVMTMVMPTMVVPAAGPTHQPYDQRNSPDQRQQQNEWRKEYPEVPSPPVMPHAVVAVPRSGNPPAGGVCWAHAGKAARASIPVRIYVARRFMCTSLILRSRESPKANRYARFQKQINLSPRNGALDCSAACRGSNKAEYQVETDHECRDARQGGFSFDERNTSLTTSRKA
jgi:hypothetical protein